MLHPIDTELLTSIGELPAREATDGDVAEAVVAYLFEMAAEPPAGSAAARILAAYVVGGETAAIEAVAAMPDVDDDRLRDMLISHAAAAVSARRLIERGGAL